MESDLASPLEILQELLHTDVRCHYSQSREKDYERCDVRENIASALVLQSIQTLHNTHEKFTDQSFHNY